jgi:hypothetical protein
MPQVKKFLSVRAISRGCDSLGRYRKKRSFRKYEQSKKAAMKK